MKKNLILLLMVFLLGIFAYLQQEKRFFSASDQLNLSSNVSSIRYRFGEIIQGRNGLQFKDFIYPLQMEKIEALIKDLNQIRLVKAIDIPNDQLNNFFPDPENFFVINDTEIRLGDKVPGSSQFYLSVKKNAQLKFYIATYEIPKSDQTYMLSEEEKFAYVWGIFNYPRVEWYDKNFIHHTLSPILRVDINHYSKKPFSLNFREGKITPESFHGLSTNLQKVAEFQQQLVNTVFNEITVDGKSLKKPIAEMIFESNGKQKKLILFSEFKNKTGLFAQFENDSQVYTLDENNAKIFYVNQSDFWFKTPLPIEAKKAAKFTLNLSHDDKIYKDFTIDEKQVPAENVSEIIRIFLGITPYEEADRISDLAKDDLIFKRGQGLYCKVGDKKFYLSVNKDEILLANLQEKHILHYYIRGGRRAISFDL